MTAEIPIERLLEITAALAGAVSQEQVFEAIVEGVSRTVGASSAGLWLLEEGESTARLVHCQGYTESTRQQLLELPLGGVPAVPVAESMRRGEPIWISSVAQLLEQYPQLGALVTPARSYRVDCLPLVANQRLLGTLGLTFEEEREETAAEREFLLLVSRYASLAIERLRLVSAARRSRTEAEAAAVRLSILGQASRAFADSNDLSFTLRLVARELSTALDSCVNIALLRADGLLHFAAVHHPHPDAQALLDELAPGSRLRVGEGITGSIAMTGRSVLLPAIGRERMAEQAPLIYRSILDRFPVTALLGAPLRSRGRVIGVVTATRTRSGETYSPEDLRLLEELAARTAVAIENNRLYEEARVEHSRAEQLYGFARAVVAADRVEQVFDAALDALDSAVGVLRSAILTFDADQVMRFRAWRGLSDAYRSTVEGHSPWHPDVTAPQPVLIEDAERDPGLSAFVPLFQNESIGALAFVPLVTRGRLIGKFMCYYEHPHRFAANEVETMLSIANHLATIIARFSATAKLEETIAQNELLAGVLAHDLRNPLNALLTAAQLLGRVDVDQQIAQRQRRFLDHILSSGWRMAAMIEQLLDFTRVRSGGGIAVLPRPMDFGELCQRALTEVRMANGDWNVQLEVRGDTQGAGDPDRLLQVLSNLVTNAGRHGTKGTPILLRVDGTSSDAIGIQVHNSGTIPPQLLPHVFEPFQSADRRRDASRGLGIGLFIVREIVRAHRGVVEVSSSEAAGTRFAIRLPRQVTDRAGAARSPE